MGLNMKNQATEQEKLKVIYFLDKMDDLSPELKRMRKKYIYKDISKAELVKDKQRIKTIHYYFYT
jgi:hypothetical protein